MKKAMSLPESEWPVRAETDKILDGMRMLRALIDFPTFPLPSARIA